MTSSGADPSGGGRTGCTASRFGKHDYSQPPHTAPDEPLPYAGDLTRCAPNCAPTYGFPYGHCDGSAPPVYLVVIFQIGTHEWIELPSCAPCTAALRHDHARLGPGRTNGVASVRILQSETSRA